MYYLAAVIPSLALGCKKKKRRNLYLLPSYHWRLLALPNRSRTATQKPTPVYAINASGYISHEISCRKHNNYTSTGIYRCSILDYDLKFCENSQWSRISADKRFQIIYLCIRRSLLQTGASAVRSAVAKLISFFILQRTLSNFL